MEDITCIYITANVISEEFAHHTREQLISALGGNTPLISVSKVPMAFGTNIYVDLPRSHLNIYRQALIGAKRAETKYIAIAEDDILYPPEHFKKRPTRDDAFAYNTACWSIYTWSKPPIFSYTGRRNHGVLICRRDLYIEAMEERFTKYPKDELVDIEVWAEPGKYEDHLKVTVRRSEVFYTDPACVMFSHPKGLQYLKMGDRKRLAPIRAYEIPFWGRAEGVVQLYE